MIRAALVTLSASVFATASAAVPVQWTVESGGNGHWYEYVLDWTAHWQEASATASASVHAGLSGYLVTIGSAAENAFVRAMASAQNPWGQATNIHIGASDAADDDDWRWAGGPEAGEELAGGYDNWISGIPPFWANYAMMDTSGSWFGTDGFGAPYVIEYSATPPDIVDPAPVVPLPATGLMLMGAFGLGGIAMYRRRALKG